MHNLKKPLKIAIICTPHGLKGAVKVKSFTHNPLALGDYGSLYSAQARIFHVEKVWSTKNSVMVSFSEIRDKSSAEALKGTELFIERSSLPPLQREEFYSSDLSGLRVFNESGQEIGKVLGVHDFGAGDILEILLEGYCKSVMIPFTCSAVPHVDIKGGALHVDSFSSGLDCVT